MKTKTALIEDALSAVEQLLVAEGSTAISDTTGWLNLPVEHKHDPSDPFGTKEKQLRLALECCLVSAKALLTVSKSLIGRPVDPSPQEREDEWKTLGWCTKIAGRSAYRAALILADPAGADSRNEIQIARGA